MVKGVLCLIIIFSCGGLGTLKAQTYRLRLDELEELRDMLNMLQTEMSYRKDPLPSVFARIASYKDNRAMDLLAECSQAMKENRNMKQCWEVAVQSSYKGSDLTREDRMMLKDLGLQLGKSDIQGQRAMFSLAEAKLRTQCQEAAKDKDTKGRMYKGLGFSIGIVIAVILI